MANASPASFDPNVLIAVETRVPHVWQAYGVLTRLGYSPAVTPTVLAALGRMAELEDNSFLQRVALRVLQQLHDSQYDLSDFSDAEKEIVDRHAHTLLEKGVIPGGNLNDARFLMEAGYRDGKAAAVTTRLPIINADRELLDLALHECGVASGSLVIFTPQGLLNYDKLSPPVRLTL